ncbi:MAG: SET domain-containing protein-lysine N-methyltransferase [Cyanobacteria bacterium HKST-UBA02]|nr:SET domain-containing protein-lysine N-methyltransferase [Cyanobacteria bacterium HKST-UBA02]
MLLVKAKLQSSPIHGIGLFADEFIPRGTTVWKFLPGFDLSLPAEEVEKLPESVQQFLSYYGFLDMNIRRWILPVDDARFMNHSREPNLDFAAIDGLSASLANRDIQPAEEITEDYRYFALEPRS